MITDEMLRLAAGELESAAMLSLPEPAECCRQFSARFQRKMKKLMYRAEHPVAYRLMRQVAAVFLAILLLGGTVLMVSPEARAAFVGWIRELYESTYHYTPSGEVSSGEDFANYRPQWLPEGYVQHEKMEIDNGVTIIYFSDNGKLMQFSSVANTVNGSGELFVEKEGYVCEQVTLNGIVADLYSSADENASNTIIWSNKAGTVLFIINASLNKEVLIRIAESVALVE